MMANRLWACVCVCVCVCVAETRTLIECVCVCGLEAFRLDVTGLVRWELLSA